MPAIDLQRLRSCRGLDLGVWPPRYDPEYMPREGEEHWFPEIECADPSSRDEIIFFKLRQQLQYAWDRSTFYRSRWQEAGVSPATLKSLDDLAKFPVIQKADLRKSQADHPPFGDYLCIELESVSRIHGTSGTTGRPTAFGISAVDWERIGEAHARVLWGAGIRPADRILICSFFSLYLGSWGALKGSERLGATVFPFGAGVAGQTRMAVDWIQIMRPTALYSTPSYALHMAETARAEGIDPRDFGIRTLLFSGEPGACIPATKRLIEETFGGVCIDLGSMAEVTPWMTDGECRQRTGMHLWQDIVYTEICDPVTFHPVPEGVQGTAIYTHLERTSQPMIRLVSNDRTRWAGGSCPCGRTYPRLPAGLFGRYDDMFIVRGENIYPSAIEDTLRATEGFGGEFQVVVSRQESMDHFLVRAEYTPQFEAEEKLAQLGRLMRQRFRTRLGVHPVVELVPQGGLPRTEFKARRVIDDRNLYRQAAARVSDDH
jgi:phenylacetate-CoA ligase